MQKRTQSSQRSPLDLWKELSHGHIHPEIPAKTSAYQPPEHPEIAGSAVQHINNSQVSQLGAGGQQ